LATVDLAVEICGVKLSNPTVLASGIVGLSGGLLVRAARSGAGAVTTKSCGLEPRQGYPNPAVLDWGGGLINAVGLSNPGVEAMREEIAWAKARLAPLGVPVIASIFAETVQGFGIVAREVSQAQPDLIEVNISCPNVEAEFGEMFAAQPESASQVTRAVKANAAIPVIVKLSPNVPDIAAIACAVEAAGADAISAVNTFGPGMVIDLETGRPVLANRVGGVSGPAIRPIAIRCVYEICAQVRIPVIGLGGVSTGRDLAEMVMAGASAVGIGSAVHRRGLTVFREVCRELTDFMQEHGYKSLWDFRGMALENAS